MEVLHFKNLQGTFEYGLGMKDHVQEIFHEVADLPVDDRNEYFDLHNVDPETRSEVVALLEFESSSNVTLDRDIAHLAQRVLARLDPQAMLCGPYRLERLLGSGGMGSVYFAERVDGEVAQRVAIKLLRPGADSSRSRERFLAERQILANLSHPNIAKLLDAGHREDGQPYLVMEYIEGKTIDVFTAGSAYGSAVSLFLKVCAAVSYLHRNLVVHRDLKPANILVTAEGEPKLLDFGIAKILDLISDPGATNMPVLTPNYASPEQALGGAASTATDVYSLGAVLYKLLTGTPPHRFEEDSGTDIVAVISSGKIMPPSELVPGAQGRSRDHPFKSVTPGATGEICDSRTIFRGPGELSRVTPDSRAKKGHVVPSPKISSPAMAAGRGNLCCDCKPLRGSIRGKSRAIDRTGTVPASPAISEPFYRTARRCRQASGFNEDP